MLRSLTAAKTCFALLLLVGVGGAAWLALRGADPKFIPPLVEVKNPEGRSIWVQTREVTVSEWEKCHAEGECSLEVRPPVFAKPGEDWPATGLSYLDVSEYLVWINKRAKHQFRLPTFKEWSALAASVMPPEPDPIFTDPELTWASAYLTENLVDRRLRVSRGWDMTKDGIWDLNGNVWEWTRDCYSGVEKGLISTENCPAFLVGGEHEAVIPFLVRDPARGGCAVGAPPPHLGMRLVTDSQPRI